MKNLLLWGLVGGFFAYKLFFNKHSAQPDNQKQSSPANPTVDYYEINNDSGTSIFHCSSPPGLKSGDYAYVTSWDGHYVGVFQVTGTLSDTEIGLNVNFTNSAAGQLRKAAQDEINLYNGGAKNFVLQSNGYWMPAPPTQVTNTTATVSGIGSPCILPPWLKELDDYLSGKRRMDHHGTDLIAHAGEIINTYFRPPLSPQRLQQLNNFLSSGGITPTSNNTFLPDWLRELDDYLSGKRSMDHHGTDLEAHAGEIINSYFRPPLSPQKINQLNNFLWPCNTPVQNRPSVIGVNARGQIAAY